jgi:hypothetical protein
MMIYARESFSQKAKRIRARELDECCGSEKFEDEIAKWDDLDVLTKLKVKEYADILSTSDEEYSKLEKTRRKLRDLLFSFTKK